MKNIKLIKSITAFFTCNFIAFWGSIITTIGAIFAIAYILSEIFFKIENQYIGFIFIMMVPPLFFGGLTIFHAGMIFEIFKHHKKDPDLFKQQINYFLKHIFGLQQIRSVFITLAVFAIPILPLTALILGFSYHYMESNKFCGTVCHMVMKPEYTVYKNSPHSRVHCVECHIGEGTSWFVRSKISGARQLLAVAVGKYSQPIPAPVEHLRPSRETCEHCHQPDKYHGRKVKVIEHFAPDRENTKSHAVLSLNVGGPESYESKHASIHWHVHPGNKVIFISEDEKREDIHWVRFERSGEEPKEYFYTGKELSSQEMAHAKKRTMECIDCHNRPTHIYQMPDEVLDNILSQNKDFQKIPFLKKAGLEVFQKKFSEQEIKKKAIAKELFVWYKNHQSETDGVNKSHLKMVAKEIQKGYRLNNWPEMEITWGTYPNHLGHLHFPGCLRCHDNTHRTKDGTAINADCNLCHDILSIKEKEPGILKDLKWVKKDTNNLYIEK